MDSCRLHFNVKCVFGACLLFFHFNSVVSDMAVSLTENQETDHYKYDNLEESKFNATSSMGQKKNQTAIQEFQNFSGLPKTVSDRLTREAKTLIPDLCKYATIDAATVTGDGRTYLFKGSQYWRYDPKHPHDNMSYPQAIHHWRGLPNDIDAAMQWINGETYFFKGSGYYRFDDTLEAVYKDYRHPPYPRPTSSWWLGCQKLRPVGNNMVTTLHPRIEFLTTQPGTEFPASISSVSTQPLIGSRQLLLSLLLLALL